jgi:hypothetical protein
MTDPYLLLTPVLALAVLALARFVGCDRLFGLRRVPDEPDLPDPPAEIPFVESFVLGQPRNNVMNPFTGWAGMQIHVGATPLTVTQLGRIMRTGSTIPHEVKIVERAGPSSGIDRGMVTIPPSAAVPPTATNPGFAYATLQPAVSLTANTDYYVLSHEDGTSSDEWHNVDGTVATADVAQVTEGAFSPDADPGVYQRLGGPGNTYGPVDFIYQEPA